MKQIRIMKEIGVSLTGALMIMGDSNVPMNQHTPISFPTDSECVLLQTCHVISVAHTGAKIWVIRISTKTGANISTTFYEHN